MSEAEETLRALVAEVVARERARQAPQQQSGIYTPSFMQVDNQTGEVQQVGPAAPIAQPDPQLQLRQAPTVEQTRPAWARREGETREDVQARLQADVNAGIQREIERRSARPVPLRGETTERYQQRVGLESATSEGIARAENAADDEGVAREDDPSTPFINENRPAPARDVPISLEDSLTLAEPEAGEGELQVAESLSPQGTAVLSFVGRRGRLVEAGTRGELGSLFSQGDINQVDFNRLALRLPSEAPTPTGGPGGRMTVTQEATLGAQVSDPTLRRAAAANDAVMAAQQNVDTGNLLASGMAVGARDQAAGLLEKQAQQAAQQAQMVAQRVQERAQRLDQAIENVAAQRIDPEGYFGQGGEGFARRLGATIAVALGQLGSVLTGGPNTALQIINASIDRNIAAQRANMEHGRASVAQQSQALNQMRDIYQDQTAAESATRALHLQAVINRLDAQLASLGPAQLAAAQQLRNALLEQRMAAQQVANERGAASIRIRTETRQPISPQGAAQVRQQLTQPSAPAQPAAAGPSQADQALDARIPSTATGGRIRQAVDRERRRQRPPAPAQPQAAAPDVYRPPPTGDDLDIQDINRMAEVAERIETGTGTDSPFSTLRPLPGGRFERRRREVRADDRQQRELAAFNEVVGDFLSNAQEILRVRSQHATDLYNPRAQSRLRTALFGLQTVMRRRGDMGTAGSVGELTMLENIINTDAGGITRFLGSPDLDVRLQQIMGHIEASLPALRSRARSYGYDLNTVGARAEANRQAEERSRHGR